MTVTVDFMLLALAGVLTFAAIRSSTYFILRFLAGLAWWGLAFYWQANPFTTENSTAVTFVVIVVFFVGLAMMAMPFWFPRVREGKEVGGGRFRLPFMKSDEELDELEGSRRLPSREERIEAYRDRLDAVQRGERRINPRKR